MPVDGPNETDDSTQSRQLCRLTRYAPRPAQTLGAVMLAAALAFGGAARTPAPAAAQADACGHDAAALIGTPLNPFEPIVTDPVVQVLCGPLAGPGSDAMAFTLSAATCWSPQGFAIYLHQGGGWTQAGFSPDCLSEPLTVVGHGIREVSPVFNQFDPRCVSTGGTRGRTWDWDGSRFTATAWKPTPDHILPAAGAKVFVTCELTDDGTPPGSWVYCWRGVRGTARHARLKANGTVDMRHRQKLPSGLGGPPISAGTTSTAGRFRCRAQNNGVKCWVRATGQGMLFTEAGARRVTVAHRRH